MRDPGRRSALTPRIQLPYRQYLRCREVNQVSRYNPRGSQRIRTICRDHRLGVEEYQGMVRWLGGQAEGRSSQSQCGYLDPRDSSSTKMSGEVRTLQRCLASRVVICTPDRDHAPWTDRVYGTPAYLSRFQG